MKPFSRFFRVLKINYVILKHGLDEIIVETYPSRSLRFFGLLSPFRYTSRRQKPAAIRAREALEELGPLFVKFGQLLSTRADLFPEDFIQELRLLQDKVQPFSPAKATAIVEKALGQPVTECFAKFDNEVLASASIAQVHAATLLTGQNVVVKILRPNVQQDIERDISLLKTIAKFAQRYSKKARQFKPKEMVLEFEKALHNELDLLREGANASQLKRNFSNSQALHIPKVYWEYSKNNILVMERVYGIPIYQINELKARGYNLKKLAELCIEIFFKQVFKDCFFHADMHPGNVFVSNHNPQVPSIITIDFGIMGSLNSSDQRYLAENFLAFFKRDYRRVADLHLKSGWIPPHVRLDEFEAAIRAVSEPMFERPLKEVSMGQLMLRLVQTATQFEINIQPQLLLLQKTLLNVESLARSLYPEIDPWETARPQLESWMRTQIGPRAFLKKLKNVSPYLLEKLPEIPELLYNVLSKDLEISTSSASAGPNPSSNAIYAKQKSWQRQKHSHLAEPHYRYPWFTICLAFLFGISLTVITFLLRSNF